MAEPPAPAAEALVAFTRALRAEGLPVGTRRVVTYTQAVAALKPLALEPLYWAGRLTLVGRREDIPVYDRVFDAYYRGRSPAAAPLAGGGLRIRVEGDTPGGAQRDPGGAVRDADEPASGVILAAASPAEVLRRKSFEAYTPEDAAAAQAIIERLARREPLRRSRRTLPTRRRGPRPDLPGTLRRSLRTHGEPLQRSWRRRRTRPRRLVLVLDISGSMAAYAESLIRFAHAAVQAGRRHVEAFVFGTRLTRITPALRPRRPDAALAAVGAAVADWQGGTRIAASLRALADEWGRRGPVRGAIVVIVSDGLERGEPGLLAGEMRRLARLAHRIVWVNPLKGSPDYRPLARGMAAALPHVDEFLPGHNLASLEDLVEVIERLGA